MRLSLPQHVGNIPIKHVIAIDCSDVANKVGYSVVFQVNMNIFIRFIPKISILMAIKHPYHQVLLVIAVRQFVNLAESCGVFQ
jgi:hypothetical protein